MKFFVDENLSRKLPALLDDRFKGSVSVAGLDLLRTPDDELWVIARDGGYVILTKDNDFESLSILHGPPPKVIRIVLPNASTRAVVKLLEDHQALISDFGADEAAGILHLP